MGGVAIRALTGAVLLVALAAGAEPLPRDQVPAPLAPWVDWVLRGHEARQCTALDQRGGQRVCAWPAQLALALDARGGRFELVASADVRTWLTLPGDALHWPSDLRIDGRPAAAVERGGLPALELAPGSHRIEGALAWAQPPQLLAIPPEVALVSLRLAGERVAFPDRDERGRLWLRPRTAPGGAGGEADRLEVLVHRRVEDGVPLLLETRIALRVSGRSREAVLGPALPVGFVPLAVSGDLPARIEPDGRLRVQVRPGRFGLVLIARRDGPATEITLPERTAPEPVWAPEEVWVFDARPLLRVVDVSGGVPVDPAQTQLPEEWKALPAWRLAPGEALRLSERVRGDSEPAADQLELTRTWILDFDGGGTTVTDELHGVVRRGMRLEMGAPTVLGRADVNGASVLVTRRAGSDRAGIEVAPGAIAISAESRVEGGVSKLPAVSWDVDVAGLSAGLGLPPGWELLAVLGADRADGTWLSRWTLLDLFVVLLVALAFGRLWGVRAGGLALAALALSYTEPGAPRSLWVAVLVAEALWRVVPAGRRRLHLALGLTRGVALAALALAALVFGVAQLRAAFFPQLERPTSIATYGYAEEGEFAEAQIAVPTPAAPSADASLEVRKAMRDRVSSHLGARSDEPAGSAPIQARAYVLDPSARLATGPGVPRWEWRRVSLTWSGPVDRAHALRLVLLPPWLNSALGVARVALIAALVLCALGAGRGGLRPWLARARRALAPGAAAAGLLAALAPAPARAELPTQPILDELRERLLAPADCEPTCATLARLALEVGPDRLAARARVELAAPAAVPLPGDARGFVPAEVLVDGRPATALARSPDGMLWLRLAPGVHDVWLRGPLPPRDTLEIPLPLAPRRVEARAAGWTVHGIRDDGSAEPSLQLVRVATGPGAHRGLEAVALPPFARVVRELSLGLEWRVTTRVERLSPPEVPIVLEIPLLEGESVTSAGVRVKDRRALVSLPPGVPAAAFVSALAQREALRLEAPAGVAWTEVWRVDASPVWHLEATGIPASQVVHEGRRLREWWPWPGESVGLAVSRPEAVAGATVTLDASALALAPGRRATDARLALDLRSSEASQHTVVLPEGAELLRLAIDGADQPLRQEKRRVVIALSPRAQHVELEWREPHGIGARFRASPVDVGLPGVNAAVEIAVPPSRWVLLAGGPRLGPAVLFWPVLAAFGALSLLLARVPLAPLRARHWFLLGIGLTQVPVGWAALVVAWLFALGWRGSSGARLRSRWLDLVQIALVALTLAALAILFESIRRGLLGEPRMQVGGNDSSAALLRWYLDRSQPELPRPWLVSAPILVYRLAMLAWALWLAHALLGWLRWGWRQFSAGELWRPLRARVGTPG